MCANCSVHRHSRGQPRSRRFKKFCAKILSCDSTAPAICIVPRAPVDSGTEHTSNARSPPPPSLPPLFVRQIKFLYYVHWLKNLSKQCHVPPHPSYLACFPFDLYARTRVFLFLQAWDTIYLKEWVWMLWNISEKIRKSIPPPKQKTKKSRKTLLAKAI